MGCRSPLKAGNLPFPSSNFPLREGVALPRLLTRKEVEQITGLSTTSIYRMMREGNFPEPIRIGARSVRWHENEIQDFIASRPRAEGERASREIASVA